MVLLDTFKTYHYLTSIICKNVLLMEPDINSIDTQLGMITEILEYGNVSCNWKSPQYESKTCKETNEGVVQILTKKKDV